MLVVPLKIDFWISCAKLVSIPQNLRGGKIFTLSERAKVLREGR
jgi:hypothetical protein